jgi:hypothetical protein
MPREGTQELFRLLVGLHLENPHGAVRGGRRKPLPIEIKLGIVLIIGEFYREGNTNSEGTMMSSWWLSKEMGTEAVGATA